MNFTHRHTAATLTALALAALSLTAQAQSTGGTGTGTGGPSGTNGPGPGAPAPGQGIGYPTTPDPAARGTGPGSVVRPGGPGASGTSGTTSSDMSGSSSGSMSGSSSSGMSGSSDSSMGSRASRSSSVGTAGTGDYGRDAYSLIPYTRRGYIGLNLGKPKYDLACGSGGYACDDPDLAVHLYTGGMFSDWLGVELGYVNTGKADRAGGSTRAQGVNLLLVGRVPVGPVNLFAKAGAIYGQGRASTGFLSDQASGRERGWGASYAAGVGFDFTPTSGVVLEWSRNEFRFPGTGRQDVDTTSLGYVHRF